MNAGPGIVNIINFIRAVEPRQPMDLVEPVQRQVELAHRHNLPVTWLLQYDALTSGPYVDLLRTLGPGHDIGVWLEIVEPQVVAAGLKGAAGSPGTGTATWGSPSATPRPSASGWPTC